MSLLAEYIGRVSTFFRHNGADIASAGAWSGSVSDDTLIANIPFIVFDTELSGLNPRQDFIVSVGALKMTGCSIHAAEEFNRLVRPEGDLSKKSVEIHGITPDDLDSADSPERVMTDFMRFINDSVLIGHFIHIDLKFVNAALKKLNMPQLRNPGIDTHSVHEWLLQNSAEFRRHFNGASMKTDLFAVAERYGVPVDSAHDALGDAIITAQLFQRFYYFFQPQGIRTLADLIDIGRA